MRKFIYTGNINYTTVVYNTKEGKVFPVLN
jgi:hypothetical protein